MYPWNLLIKFVSIPGVIRVQLLYYIARIQMSQIHENVYGYVEIYIHTYTYAQAYQLYRNVNSVKTKLNKKLRWCGVGVEIQTAE
jgi:hypothetical protein